MLKGVWLNGGPTISNGFIVLDDIIIGAPEVKRSTVDIPGADGVIDNSYIYGRPLYNNRKISFRLFFSAAEAEWEKRRKNLYAKYHGQRVHLTLPQDVPDADPYEILDAAPYWDGVLSFGDTAGYAGGVLPVTVDCAPYQLVPSADRSYILSSALGITSEVVTIYNDGAVSADIEIETSGDVNLSFISAFTGKTVTVTLAKGVYDAKSLYVRGLSVEPGSTSITLEVISSATIEVTVKTAGRRL